MASIRRVVLLDCLRWVGRVSWRVLQLFFEIFEVAVRSQWLASIRGRRGVKLKMGVWRSWVPLCGLI